MGSGQGEAWPRVGRATGTRSFRAIPGLVFSWPSQDGVRGREGEHGPLSEGWARGL